MGEKSFSHEIFMLLRWEIVLSGKHIKRATCVNNMEYDFLGRITS
jgi:hypothetical protein